MLGRFAHVLLFAVGIVFLIASAVISSWYGIFGTEIAGRLHSLYEMNSGELKNFAQLLGAIGTLATALFTIFKAWHYADLNLPDRLEAYLSKCNEKLVSNRDGQMEDLKRQHSARQKSVKLSSSLRSLLGFKPIIPEVTFRNFEGGSISPNATISEIQTKLQKRVEVLEQLQRHNEAQLARSIRHSPFFLQPDMAGHRPSTGLTGGLFWNAAESVWGG